MILPKDDECRRIISELEDEPSLTEWEYEFITSNLHRTQFTDKQRESIARFKEKYDV